MPRRDLSTEEKGLEFSLRCPHWRREGNKHLVGNLAVGMGSKSWGSGWRVGLALSRCYTNQCNVVGWVIHNWQQDQRNRLGIEYILVYEELKDTQTANDELIGYLINAVGKMGYLGRNHI